jgi:hypothetical protein
MCENVPPTNKGTRMRIEKKYDWLTYKDGKVIKTEKVTRVTFTAPWTSWQIDSLNCYQRSGMMHPFTCRAGGHSHGVLEATKDGWVCNHRNHWENVEDFSKAKKIRPCSYIQDWCHEFMADWSWIFIHRSLDIKREELVDFVKQTINKLKITKEDLWEKKIRVARKCLSPANQLKR